MTIDPFNYSRQDQLDADASLVAALWSLALIALEGDVKEHAHSASNLFREVADMIDTGNFPFVGGMNLVMEMLGEYAEDNPEVIKERWKQIFELWSESDDLPEAPEALPRTPYLIVDNTALFEKEDEEDEEEEEEG